MSDVFLADAISAIVGALLVLLERRDDCKPEITTLGEVQKVLSARRATVILFNHRGEVGEA
jgi:hypothetical protein